jgi:hypothetical protein
MPLVPKGYMFRPVLAVPVALGAGHIWVWVPAGSGLGAHSA